MRTAVALPEKLQMIGGDGKFYSETASFTSELKNYTVISIIGPQSSGKSYLLNNLFQTGFDVLNAAAGRKQTTKGIWIARCINPGMVIMDVEGCDGKERGQDKLFERQSALFSLIVSDVLLLNISFQDIGRQNGANIPLIELIFKERVNIEATKTKIIVVVRDTYYDDDETPPDVTRKQIDGTMNEIWQNMHPGNNKMSDYVEVIVKDFPHKSKKQEFALKCKDLSNLLSSAANENMEEANYVSGFAKSSELIWDRIRSDKKLIAADHKVQRSKFLCKKTKKSLLRSLDEGKMGKWMNDVKTTSVKKFMAGFPSVRNDILTRYEAETASLLITVRDEKKAKLENKLQERFGQGFCARLDYLARETLDSAELKLKPTLKNLKKLDDSAIIGVIKPYMREFDDNTDGDLKGNEDLIQVLNEKRRDLASKLTDLAIKKANKIKLKRGLLASAVGITTIPLGAAWAAMTLDPSLILASVALTCAAAQS